MKPFLVTAKLVSEMHAETENSRGALLHSALGPGLRCNE